MKRLSFLIVIVPMLVMTSCYRWPAVYLGDTSGIISYDRLNHRLEILWERHTQVQDNKQDTTRIDTLNVLR